MATKLTWRRIGLVDLGDGLGTVNYTGSKYVHPLYGNDIKGTGTPDNPFKTIRKAVESGGSGIVVAGYVTENLSTLNFNGRKIYGDGFCEFACFTWRVSSAANFFNIVFNDIDAPNNVTAKNCFFKKTTQVNTAFEVDSSLVFSEFSGTFFVKHQNSTFYAKKESSRKSITYQRTYLPTIHISQNIYGNVDLTFSKTDNATNPVSFCIFLNCRIRFGTNGIYELYDNTTTGADGLVNDISALRKRAKLYYDTLVAGEESLFTNCVIKKEAEAGEVFNNPEAGDFSIPINGIAHSLSNNGTYCGALPPALPVSSADFDLGTAQNIALVDGGLQLVNEALPGSISTKVIDLVGIHENIAALVLAENVPLAGKYVDYNTDLSALAITSGQGKLTANNFYLNGNSEIIIYLSETPVTSGNLIIGERYFAEGTVTHNGNSFTNDTFVAQNLLFAGEGKVFHCINIPAYHGFKAYTGTFRGLADYTAGSVKEVYEMPNKLTVEVGFSRYSPDLSDGSTAIMLQGAIMQTDSNGKGNGDTEFGSTGITNIRARYLRFKFGITPKNAK